MEDGNFRLSTRMWTPDWVETGWLMIVILVTLLCYFITKQSEEGQIYTFQENWRAAGGGDGIYVFRNESLKITAASI